MSRKSNIKNVIRIILFTLLTPLLILYLIAQHFIEPNKYISLRYTLLDYFVDLYNAWREIFELEYIDKSVELSRYNRKLMYGKPAKKLLGLNKEQMDWLRSEEHTSELQSRFDLVCRLLLEKKNNTYR